MKKIEGKRLKEKKTGRREEISQKEVKIKKRKEKWKERIKNNRDDNKEWKK